MLWYLAASHIWTKQSFPQSKILFCGGLNMTQITNHQTNSQKLTQIVENLIDNNPIYQENLDRQEMILMINQNFNPVAIPDLNSISEEELIKRIKRILSLNLVSGMLNDFTPEQMRLFDESVKRG